MKKTHKEIPREIKAVYDALKLAADEIYYLGFKNGAKAAFAHTCPKKKRASK